jgi:hypothetical protein
LIQTVEGSLVFEVDEDSLAAGFGRSLEAAMWRELVGLVVEAVPRELDGYME